MKIKIKTEKTRACVLDRREWNRVLPGFHLTLTSCPHMNYEYKLESSWNCFTDILRIWMWSLLSMSSSRQVGGLETRYQGWLGIEPVVNEVYV